MTTLSDGLMAALDASIEDVSKASTLPAELYTSADVLALETEAIFMKEWLCVGRAERIPNVGDWFTVTIVDEPLIIARNKAGDVCAMSAVCQHRAMQVCEGEGNSTTFKCPYHHWNYGLDGRLLGAPAMERTEAFNKADFGLPQLRVEEWLGFVFVNFDQDASPLAPTLERYSPFVHNYDLENAVCPGTFTLEGMPWNWKVMFENFNDGYHANRLHEYVQDFCPSNLSDFPVPWSDDSNVIFRTGGYTHIDGGFNATHRVIMEVFPDLTEEERTRSTFALMPPTLCFGTAPDQCFFFLIRPPVPRRLMLRSATSSTRRHLTTRSLIKRWPCRMRECRFLWIRTKTRPPRCNGDCAQGSRRVAATRGRKKVTSSSTGGLSSGTGRVGSQRRKCGNASPDSQ